MSINRPLKKLSEIGVFIRGITYHKEELLPSCTNGCVTLLRSNNIQNNLNLDELQYLPKSIISDEKIVKEGDVLFCMSNGSKDLVGKNIILPRLKDYSFGAFCSIFRPNDVESSAYIQHFLRSSFYKDYIYGLSRGIGINNLRNSDLEVLEIPLPPLATQKAIVAKLDEAFALLDESTALTQANIARLDEMTKSVLDKVFEEGEWEKVKLGQLCDIITGNTPSTKYKDFYGGNILWAGPGDFGDFKYVETTKKTISDKGLNEGHARLIKKGSVMLVAIGATIGKVGIAGKNMTTNQQINTFEMGKTLNNSFLYYYLRKIKNFFVGMASQTTLPILNKSQCKEIEIPLPPLTKQQEIVDHLDKVFAETKQLKAEYEAKLQQLKELKASVLQSAFGGKLV